MKAFFSNYSYSIIKMFVNQFAISIFGAVLSMATEASGNRGLTIVVSCFAILFYLFLIYTLMWEVGAKDRIHVDMGKIQKRPHTGLVMSIIANIPNFILAIMFTVAFPFMATSTWAGNLAAIASTITIFIQGMFLGCITSFSIGDMLLNKFWWTYFIIIIPALVTSWIAYYVGYREFRLFATLSGKGKNNQNKK